MSEQEDAGRLIIDTNEGLLTEEDLGSLLALPAKTIVSYIEDGRLPGKRITPRNAKQRTLTSVRELISFVESRGKEKQPE